MTDMDPAETEMADEFANALASAPWPYCSNPGLSGGQIDYLAEILPPVVREVDQRAGDRRSPWP